ncbi:unnamed protein product [Gordionus sp. m RMFG-2023]
MLNCLNVKSILYIYILISSIYDKCNSYLKTDVQNHKKSVITTLQTQWSDTPLVFEASEFFNEENEALYWDFIEKINTYYMKIFGSDELYYTNGKSEYKLLIKIASNIYKNNNANTWINFLKFSIALRIYSPKIETFNQIYLEDKKMLERNVQQILCSQKFYIQFKNLSFCDANEFSLYLHSSTHKQARKNDPCLQNDPQLTIYKSVDHRYPSPLTPRPLHTATEHTHKYDCIAASLPPVVLYSDFRSAHFRKNHGILKDLSLGGSIQYYFRPVFALSDTKLDVDHNRKTFLSGFGVELTIKNTEYRAKDDDGIKNTIERIRSDKEKNIDTYNQYLNYSNIFHDDDDYLVQGFNFTRLNENYADYKMELNKIKDELIEQNIEIQNLKAWETQDLSFQAAQIVTKAQRFDERLKILKDISQNFPSRAPSLTGIKVDKDFQKEIAKNQLETFELLNLAKGDSAFYINRMQIDMDNFNIYDMLQTLRKEIKPMNVLHHYGIQGQDMYDILSTGVELKEEEIALDFKNTEAIKYLNDLEIDDEYKKWAGSLNILEQTFWFGMITEIRKNLFNVIMLLSPLSFLPSQKDGNDQNNLNIDLETLKLLKEFQKFHKNNQPFHLGIVLVYEDLDSNGNINDNPKYNNASLLLHSAFNYAYINGKKKIEALDLLIQILDHAIIETGPSKNYDKYSVISDAVCSSISTKYGLTRDDCLKLSSNSKYNHDIDTGREYYENSGLEQLPQVLFNGVPMTKQQIDNTLFEKEITNLVTKAYYTYYEAYFNNVINDRTDIIDYLNQRSNVLPRINKNILSITAKYLDFRILNYTTDLKTLRYDDDSITPYLPHIVSEDLVYLYKKTDSSVKPITIWLITDLDSFTGKKLILSTLKFLKSSMYSRIAIVHNPVESLLGGDKKFDIKYIIENWAVKLCSQSALESQKDINIVKLFLNKLIKIDKESLSSIYNDVIDSNNNNVNKEILTDAHLFKAVIEKILAQYGVTNIDQEAFKRKSLELYTSMTTKQNNVFKLHSEFSLKTLLAHNGESLIVANGKIIRTLIHESPFSSSDFSLMEKFLYNAVGKNLAKKLEDDIDTTELSLSEFKLSDIIMKLSSALLSNNNEARRIKLKIKHEKHGACINQDEQKSENISPKYEIMAILNPLSRAAQILSQVLLVFNEVLNADIKVCFNSKPKLSEMPLKNYYRYVLNSELKFSSPSANSEAIKQTDKSNNFSLIPSAIFQNLPRTPLLTMIMYPPQNWMIQSIITPYDLDNIHMDEIPTDVYATFELEYLLLEGHCFDKTSEKPPRGLQFTMGPPSDPLMVDTIVMANLGYFQLKAHPGAFILKLRAGKSEEIYKIVGHKNTDSLSSESKDILVVLDNFLGKTIHVKVTKKPDKMNEDILIESLDPKVGGKNEKEKDENNSGMNQKEIMDFEDNLTDNSLDEILEEDDEIVVHEDYRIKGKKINNGTNRSSSDNNKSTINIFSVASGHLYERFLKIMMLSVLKHTKNPVKFWFLKNYLSPSFKDYIPKMANAYNFQYELVQYKWPQWLNQQTEKQRIIWGYKILFLDVLFPLDVDKIIYVDADQIVRADMKDLIDLDLNGAPYGYTPFCDSRTEMEGFRFWKTGYWASHLAHRKYHISALYVVDLKKFRQIAAGDRLRGQYQGLSQDPNSLSNLDQDLPNNMIHQVMIKSLPQEWLWCETWCDDASKSNAKTIDLCNNPMTKEPKLHSAMRIIPEWVDYDNEIKELTKLLESSQSIITTPILNKNDALKNMDGDSNNHVEL